MKTSLNEIERLEELATALDKAASRATGMVNRLARRSGCVLISSEKLKALEALYESALQAILTSSYTRDYADVLKQHPDDGYNGKRLLVRRQEAEHLHRALRAVAAVKNK